jgi:hypothetical protein
MRLGEVASKVQDSLDGGDVAAARRLAPAFEAGLEELIRVVSPLLG